MAITVSCPQCGLACRFPDEWQGRSVLCVRCQASITLHIDTLIPLESESRVLPPSLILEPPADELREQQWVGEEARRFRTFVGQQLAKLRQERHDLAALHSQLETKAVLREQELNRLQAAQAARDEALRQRQEVVARQEEALARGREELVELEQTLREFQEQRDQAEREIVDLRRLVNCLRGDAEALQQGARDARDEMAAVEEQRHALEAEQAAWAERVAQWDRLQADLARQEQSLQGRTVELEELEERVRGELERRARELELRQELLDAREAKAPRATGPDLSALKEKLKVLCADHRMTAAAPPARAALEANSIRRQREIAGDGGVPGA